MNVCYRLRICEVKKKYLGAIILNDRFLLLGVLWVAGKVFAPHDYEHPLTTHLHLPPPQTSLKMS